MAVYREGFSALEQYKQRERQIWNDSCDMGVVVKKDDSNWNLMMLLVEMYGDKETRKVTTSNQVEIQFTLIDEWAVSDERKTVKQATEVYSLNYYKFTKRDLHSVIQRGYHGFFSINRVK